MKLNQTGFNVLELLAKSTGRTIDSLYATLVHRMGLSAPFFSQGWGNLSVVDFARDAQLLGRWPPPSFQQPIHWQRVAELKQYGVDCQLYEASFRTPCGGAVFDALPTESRAAHCQLLLPRHAPAAAASRAVVHLAGTGDFGHERRTRLAGPLLKQGVAAVSLESPFYGRRKPAYQSGSKLHRVSDLLALGRATIDESLFLLHWLSQNGFGRLGVSGFSMGGVHASMVASLWPGPLACTPLLAPRSAAIAFVEGALQRATAWEPLAKAADEKEQDIRALLEVAAQPNLVTTAAARILHGSAAMQSFLQDSQPSAAASSSSLSPPSLSASGPSPSAAAPAAASTQQQQQSGDRAPSNAKQQQPASVQFAAETASRQHKVAVAAEVAAAEALGSGTGRDCGEQQRPAGQYKGKELGEGDGIGQAKAQLRELVRVRQGINTAEAQARLAAVLETYTDVTRFPRPQRSDAAVLVAATHDAYVSRQSVEEWRDHWPGCEVRWVPGGHVTSFVFHQHKFREAILDSLARLDGPPVQPTC